MSGRSVWDKARPRLYAALGGMAALFSVLVSFDALDVRWWPWRWELEAVASELSDVQQFVYAREVLELQLRLQDIREKKIEDPNNVLLSQLEREIRRRIQDVERLRKKAEDAAGANQ